MLLSGVVCGHPCELGRGPVVGMERDVMSQRTCQKDLTCMVVAQQCIHSSAVDRELRISLRLVDVVLVHAIVVVVVVVWFVVWGVVVLVVVEYHGMRNWAVVVVVVVSLVEYRGMHKVLVVVVVVLLVEYRGMHKVLVVVVVVLSVEYRGMRNWAVVVVVVVVVVVYDNDQEGHLKEIVF